MGYHVGKSFFSLDFSIPGEKGKNQNKPYGLTPAQAKKCYSKKRDKTSIECERTNDYFFSKIDSMIFMIHLAIAKGIRFDYLLVVSWFTCYNLVKFIVSRPFLCKSSKKGNWNSIMTTNTELTFEQAYKIYSTRWSVELFFKESKQHPGLGKCQAQDFDAQIAATTVYKLQYNLLSVVKRFNDYETLGELFRALQKDALKLTISEQIWLIIIEVIAVSQI